MKKDRFTFFYKLLALMLTLSVVAFSLLLLYYKLLPLNIRMIITGILLLLTIILSFFLRQNRLRKSIRKFSVFCSVLIIAITAFGSYAQFRGIDALSLITDYKVDTESYFLITENDHPAQELEDLRDTTIAVYRGGFDNDEEAITQLGKDISYYQMTLTDLSKIKPTLIQKEVEAILISESIYSSINDNDQTFKSETKVIKEYIIKTATTDLRKPVNVLKEPYNIFLSATDSFGKISSIGRSDVNMVVTINPKDETILLTTIPRDYYLQLDGTDGYKDKLTHASNYGVESSIKTIENLLDLDINYYVRINFSTLTNLVDEIGGIEVYSAYDFSTSTNPPYNFKEGMNWLDGTAALIFSRERKMLPEELGDLGRGQNQVNVFKGILNKLMTSPAILVNYEGILNTVEDSFKTNLNNNDIIAILNEQIKHNPQWEVSSQQLDGETSIEICMSTQEFGASSVVIPDEDSVRNAIEKIHEAMIIKKGFTTFK